VGGGTGKTASSSNRQPIGQHGVEDVRKVVVAAPAIEPHVEIVDGTRKTDAVDRDVVESTSSKFS